MAVVSKQIKLVGIDEVKPDEHMVYRHVQDNAH